MLFFRNVLFELIPPLEVQPTVTAPSSVQGSPDLRQDNNHNLDSGEYIKVQDLLSDLSLDNHDYGNNASNSEKNSPTQLFDNGIGFGGANTAVPSLSLTCVGSYLAYSRYGLDITFKRFEDSPMAAGSSQNTSKQSTIRAVFLNDQSDYTIHDLLLQIAVPKSFTLFLNPPSTTVLAPHQEGIQIMTIKCLKAPSTASNIAMKLRVKVSFRVDEESVEDLFDFVFPDLD